MTIFNAHPISTSALGSLCECGHPSRAVRARRLITCNAALLSLALLACSATRCAAPPVNERDSAIAPSRTGVPPTDESPEGDPGPPAQSPGEMPSAHPPTTGPAPAEAKAPASSPPEATSRPAAPAHPRLVDYATGIRIDYRVPQVEIDGEIILREGPLELFAYAKAPTPKEHESIVLLRSRPLRIFEALGLIGLVPGATAHYLPDSDVYQPPTGDAVDVFVRVPSPAPSTQLAARAGRRERPVVEPEPPLISACDWMINQKTGKPMERSHWLFTGSQRFANGQFYADLEGTVVTVVDFPSSILSVPASHSSSDSELWLTANTEAIPPKGTRVVLILRPAKQLTTTQPGDQKPG